MLQVQEPGRSHVMNDAMLEEIFKGFNDEYNCAMQNGNPADQVTYNHNEQICDIIEESTDRAKPNYASAVNSNDYKDVTAQMTSPSAKLKQQLKTTTPDVGNTRDYDDVINSNRSSASSMSITTSSVTSAELSSSSVMESEGEKPTSKYAQLDIAKILHTRKRIHKILQVSIEGVQGQEEQSNEVDSNNKKKLSLTTKRQTQLGTFGNTKGRSVQSQLKRYSSSSRTPSTDDECFDKPTPVSNYSTLDMIRSRKDENGNRSENAKWFPSGSKTDGRLSADFELESEEDKKVNSRGYENKRWSLLSSASLSSDKTSQTPQKGPWKAFRKFVNNSNSASRSQMEKDTVEDHFNASNNNSSKLNTAATRSSKDDADPCWIADTSLDYQSSPSNNNHHQISSKHRTHSLLRRFSKKSSSRGRSSSASRRKSLPSHDAWNVQSGNWKDASSPNSSRKESPLPRFQYGDGSQVKVDIESMVMSSMQSRIEEESQKPEEKIRKSTSFRKRIMSFTRKRSSSRERKTILKSKNQAPSNNKGQMNKNLSYSSPQLSVFAVNSPSSHSGGVQKLQF